jgi:hypothetical protein
MLRRFFLTFTIALSFMLTLAANVPAQTAPGTPAVSAPDLGTLQQEAVGWLEGLIRINTTNPPGNELAAANYIAAILE